VSLSSDVSAFFGDGTFHEEDEKGENRADYGKDQETVKIRESQGLLIAQIPERLESHLLGPNRVTGLLKVAGLSLSEKGCYSWVQRIEILAES
jgi:hypothetical protein